jgi:putative endonuclease
LSLKNIHQQRGKTSWKRGWWAEWIACAFLTLKGYRLLERRYKTPLGEIDLIMRHGKSIVFIEVKSRPDINTAAYAIGLYQQQRLHRAALKYLMRYPAMPSARFDVILITKGNRLKHIQNAWSREEF